MRGWRRVSLLLLFPALGVLRAAAPPGVEGAVRDAMERLHVPGLSLAVANNLRLVWAAGFGMADVENSVPATAATVYRLGSVSKPITAVAVLQLAEAGKLDLDAPIQRYVPSFPKKRWPVTARELLGHLAGIRHYGSLAEVNSTRHYTNLTDPLGIFEREPLLFEPGSRFFYSSYGYDLLGAAVERASGLGFLEYLRERIFRPAGMQRIEQDDLYRIIPHRARGYRRTFSGEIRNCDLADTSNKVPAGGLVSTPGDLARFSIALERGALLGRDTLQEMFTSQRTRDGEPTGYGLGWHVFHHDGHRWVGHSGAQQGVSTFLLALPERGLAVALMANLEGLDLGPLALRIADLMLHTRVDRVVTLR